MDDSKLVVLNVFILNQQLATLLIGSLPLENIRGATGGFIEGIDC